MNIMRLIIITAASVLVSASLVRGSESEGTAFTYQGVFKQAGTPASGTHHLRFQLWDSLAGGAQISADVERPALLMVDGMFTTSLDFGALAFNGEARWLQVQVITNGGNTVTTLVPRQPISPTPYALFARAADGANIDNLNASNLVAGTLPSAQFAGTYGNAIALSNTSNAISGIFTGNGADVTGLNAANIASGTIAAERMPAAGNWPMTGTLNLDAGTLAVDPANNRVGIGTASPAGPLHVRANVPHLLLQDTASAANQSGYIDFRSDTFVSTGWIGYGTPGSPDLSIVNARGAGDIVLLTLGGGGVGIGTGAPAVSLHVRKPGPVMVLQDTASDSNQAGYVGFWNSSGAETGWMGYGTPGSPHLTVLNARHLGNIVLSPGTSGSVLVPSARVSIGSAFPIASLLHVEGSVNVGRFVNTGTGGSAVEGITTATSAGAVYGVFGRTSAANGFDFFAAGTVGTRYGQVSSRRWKRNITPIESPLERIEQIRGVWFDWDADHGGHHDVGMIAEEVGAVMPEIVAYEENGIDASGMDYSKLTPLLVEAVKALRAEKDAEIARLNDRITELERLVRESLASRPR